METAQATVFGAPVAGFTQQAKSRRNRNWPVLAGLSHPAVRIREANNVRDGRDSGNTPCHWREAGEVLVLCDEATVDRIIH